MSRWRPRLAWVIALCWVATATFHASGQDPPTQTDPVAPPADQVDPPEPMAREFVLLVGQITDPMGAGIPGVSVSVHRVDGNPSSDEPIATATTDVMGDFTVVSDRPFDGTVLVHFSKPSYLSFWQQAELNPDGRPRQSRFKPGVAPPFIAGTLKGALALTGRVENAADHQPVSGATVVLSAGFQEWKSRSDASGAFRIDGILPGRGELTVTADGFGRERRRIPDLSNPTKTAPGAGKPSHEAGPDEVPAQPDQSGRGPAAQLDQAGHRPAAPGELVIALKPERVVHIAVVDEADESVSGAVLELRDDARGDYRTVISDESGLAVVGGLHFDTTELALRVQHDAHVSSTDFDQTLQLPEDKVESSHTIVMQPAVRITGVVVEAATGDPVYGARVSTGSDALTDSPRDWTDSEGRFEIGGVPPGQAVLTVHMAGFAPDLKTIETQAGDGGPRTLRPGVAGRPGSMRVESAAPSVRFELEPAAVIRGRVVGEEGMGVEAAEIGATRWRGFETLGLWAMTNANGEFVIESAPNDAFEARVTGPAVKPTTTTISAAMDQPIAIQVERISPGSAKTLAVGTEVPNVSLTLLDGTLFDLAAQQGKVVVIDFWATWCAPCLEEMPRLIELHEAYRGRKDFTLLGISRDFSESDLRAYLEANPRVAWPQAVGGENGVEDAVAEFGVDAYPTLYVIDQEGRIGATGLTAAQLPGVVEKLLAANGSAKPEPPDTSESPEPQ